MYVGGVSGGTFSERALRMSSIQASHCCSAPSGNFFFSTARELFDFFFLQIAEGFCIEHPQKLSLARLLALSLSLACSLSLSLSLALSHPRSLSLSLSLALSRSLSFSPSVPPSQSDVCSRVPYRASALFSDLFSDLFFPDLFTV
jgi:hypothetical protein